MSAQITSRFDGVIKKLYYEPDDMAKVGKVRRTANHHTVISLTILASRRHRHTKRDIRSRRSTPQRRTQQRSKAGRTTTNRVARARTRSRTERYESLHRRYSPTRTGITAAAESHTRRCRAPTTAGEACVPCDTCCTTHGQGTQLEDRGRRRHR